jgi:hypothetical protein
LTDLRSATATGAAIVRVEYTALAPGVTEVGESVQEGAGVGPFTEHESAIALSNEVPSGRNVRSVDTVLPGLTVKLVSVGAKKKFGPCSNVAVTVWSAFMATSQPGAILFGPQAPPQPPNTDPASGCTCRLTLVPVGRLVLQELPQLMDDPATVPLPAPDFVTVKVNIGST